MLDISATHHFTPSLDGMSMVAPYRGKSQVMVSSGKTVPILHVRKKTLCTNSKLVNLNHVFHALELSRNLLSVSQLCSENNVMVEFDFDSFVIKDRETNKLLLQGTRNNGLYLVSSPRQSTPRDSPTSGISINNTRSLDFFALSSSIISANI